jgi:hypothetical protein
MSVSIHFQAIIPVDSDAYRKHKSVVDACLDAGVPTPEESVAFFSNGRDEDREVTERGVLVSLDYGRVRAVEGDVMYDDGAFIDLAKLPAGTTKIRVYAA